MNLLAWWRWYRTLPQNPIYLREKGLWGKPNPFFNNLMRFSPLILVGSIGSGFCGGFGNPFLFGDNDDLFAIWCLVCLPGILLFMVTIFGTLMAPALTAPMISLERDTGTWDILRVTPQPMPSILMAKLLGALSRLRIWPVLFVLSLFQGLVMFCSLSLIGDGITIWEWLLGITTVARPWLEILFAAFSGLFFSTTVRSSTMALISTYALVVIFKLFNSSLIWIGFVGSTLNDEVAMFAIGTIGPTAVYSLVIPIMLLGILYQAGRIGD